MKAKKERSKQVSSDDLLGAARELLKAYAAFRLDTTAAKLGARNRCHRARLRLQTAVNNQQGDR